MSHKNPLAWAAVVVSLVPFLSALALVGLATGIGPGWLITPVLKGSGFAMFGLIIVGTGLAFGALGRSEGRSDWRIYAAFGFQVLAIAGSLFFMVKG